MSVDAALSYGGERLVLRPERAVFLSEHRTVLVADVHIGKARAFRQLGVPVPGGTTQDTLQRLGALVDATQAEHLVVLGDLLHSAHAQGSTAMAALAAWREARPALRITLVRGNHDDRAGDPPASLAIDIVDEPHPFGGLLLCHHPTARVPAGMQRACAEAGRAIARVGGHVHPAVRVHGRANDSLRLPAFHVGADFLVLPAFGAFTGMHTVRARPGERLFAVVEDQVVAV